MASMAKEKDEYFSIRLTRFFMKVIGFWNVKTKRERIILNLGLTYTLAAVIFAIAVEGVDLLHCYDDFNAVTYNACATMSLVLVLIKMSVFLMRRTLVANLINFTEQNFWNVQYNEFGEQIMKECEIMGRRFVSTFTFFVSGTVFNYILAPIIENIGKDPADRILPFKLWVDLPYTETPYFEIIFTIQALSTIHAGICFFCFDNLLCILNIHTVGQLKILQHRIVTVSKKYSELAYMEDEESTTNRKIESEAYDEFKSCVDQHRTLMNYIDTLESLFNFILLCQMTVSSVLMCLSVFQVFLGNNSFPRRLIFVSLVFACNAQLLLFTWSCNEIILESQKIGDAAYHSDWYAVPHRGAGKALKEGILIVMARVNRPSFLSAGKFCPMSLQTFTSILSTAVSYFTLLRQMSEELE